MSPRLVLSLKLLLEQIVEFYFAWRERAWKRKAVKRGMKVRDFRKKVNRLQQRRAVVLAENAGLREENTLLKKKPGNALLGESSPCPRLSKEDVRSLSVLIVINAVVSFRSVPRIFQQVLAFTPGLAFKVPCHNSVINWTLRYGHHLLSTVSKLADEWFAVVDMSIETGLGKALVVLRVPFAKWNMSANQALSLADCECIGVDVREDWKSDRVKAYLEELFAKTGTPAFIVKDKGSDITKGVRLLEIPDVSDIGHELANGLKDRFARDKWFAAFLALIAACGATFRQTRLAFLTPPKIRTKGRFQSIARLADWAIRVMAHFDANIDGRQYPAHSLLIMQLEKLKVPITRLARACSTVNDILSIPKKIAVFASHQPQRCAN